MVQLARLWRGLLEGARAGVGHLYGLLRADVFDFDNDVLRAQARTSGRSARGSHSIHRRATGEAIHQAGAARDFTRRLVGDCVHHRRRYGGAVADAGVVVVCAAGHGCGRSGLRTAAGVLSLYSACVAIDSGLAAHTQRHQLRGCSYLSAGLWQFARAHRARQPERAAVAWAFGCGWISAANCRRARLSRALRAALRAPYYF